MQLSKLALCAAAALWVLNLPTIALAALLVAVLTFLLDFAALKARNPQPVLAAAGTTVAKVPSPPAESAPVQAALMNDLDPDFQMDGMDGFDEPLDLELQGQQPAHAAATAQSFAAASTPTRNATRSTPVESGQPVLDLGPAVAVEAVAFAPGMLGAVSPVADTAKSMAAEAAPTSDTFLSIPPDFGGPSFDIGMGMGMGMGTGYAGTSSMAMSEAMLADEAWASSPIPA